MRVKFTEEQQAAIDWAIEGRRFSLIASAGSGKTLTAQEMIVQLRGKKVCYLVYNKEARLAAEKAFGEAGLTWVDVRTTSQIAWHAYAYLKGMNGAPDPNYEERMRPGATPVPSRMVATTLKLGPVDFGGGLVLDGYMQANLALAAVEKFCHSGRERIEPRDVPLELDGYEPALLEAARIQTADLARRLWLQSMRPTSKLRFTMDHAFKLVAENENYDLGYDVILVDEAQDSNDATMQFLGHQKNAQIILIGDPAQALYEWRGASDQLLKFDAKKLHLTQSFRFGKAVAEEAMKHLPFTQTGVTVRGLATIQDQVTDGGMADPDVVLCRTNGGAMEWAMSYLGTGKRVSLTRGTDQIKQMAFAAADLRADRPPRSLLLSAFATWADLVEFTTEPGGGHLKPIVNLINAYGIHKLIAACDKMTPYNPKSPKHDVAISTCHSIKGLEWDRVQLGDDFRRPDQRSGPGDGVGAFTGEIDRHEAMLHYVAVTRARKHLDRSGRNGLGWIDDYPADLPQEAAA